MRQWRDERSTSSISWAAFGQHRRPIPDLLVVATALEHDATVLHYDHDFDLIADATGVSARWIIPAGTGHGDAS